MKRFYTRTEVQGDQGAWRVLLDGRPIRTPKANVLELPTPALAEGVEREWADQGERIDAFSMPLMRLATTAVDLMPARRRDAIEEVVGYATSDLLCYHSSAPQDLVARQHERWQPWLRWLKQTYGADLHVTRDLDPIPQPEATLARLGAEVEAQDAWNLVALHAATTLTGSIVLGLATVRGAIDPEDAFAAAFLDELYEMERWGRDDEQLSRHQRLRRDLRAAAAFARACAHR